jgi:hypothetical protein
MCAACGCGKKKGDPGFGKGPKSKSKKAGSHMMPNGKMMKDSAMKMAKKKAGK